MDDTFEGFDVSVDAEFIDRRNHINKLQDAWTKHKLFCVFGLRQVGKTRFVKEFVNRKVSEILANKPDTQIVFWQIDLRTITDIPTLHSHICTLVGVVPDVGAKDSTRWKQQIVIAVNKSQKILVIVFDNVEDAVDEKGDPQKGVFKDELQSLCVMLVKQCRNLKLFITSTTKVMFSRIRYLTLELPPLVQFESTQLLRSVTPGVELGKYEAELVTLTEGIPLMILMVVI